MYSFWDDRLLAHCHLFLAWAAVDLKICTGAHLDLMIDNVDDLEENELVKRLQAATGAHKPNGYEFEPGVVTSAEGFLNG